MFLAGKEKRWEQTMTFLAFLNHRKIQRPSERIGRVWYKKSMRLIPLSARNVRETCGSSALSKTSQSFGTSSHIWNCGFSGQGRSQKAMPRQPSYTPPPISKSNHSMILSTATPNTLGMNTSSHNAFWKKACMIGLSEFCKKYHSCGWKDQKVSKFLKRTDVAMSPRHYHWRLTLHFVAKIPLTYKTGLPIVQPCRNNILSKKSKDKRKRCEKF